MAPKTSDDALGRPKPEFDADPPHPDGFPGSDEESHLMNSRQGMKELGYGVNAAQTRRIMEEAGVTREEAKELLKKMHEEFPATSGYTAMLNRELGQTGLHDFHVGDTLLLRDWDPEEGGYTGRRIEVEVTYITDGSNLGCLVEGHVCMGIRRLP